MRQQEIGPLRSLSLSLSLSLSRLPFETRTPRETLLIPSARLKREWESASRGERGFGDGSLFLRARCTRSSGMLQDVLPMLLMLLTPRVSPIDWNRVTRIGTVRVSMAMEHLEGRSESKILHRRLRIAGFAPANRRIVREASAGESRLDDDVRFFARVATNVSAVNYILDMRNGVDSRVRNTRRLEDTKKEGAHR
jgi:hypothetical protein